MIETVKATCKSDVDDVVQLPASFKALKELVRRHGFNAGLYVSDDTVAGGVIQQFDDSALKVHTPYTLTDKQPFIRENADSFIGYGGTVVELDETVNLESVTHWLLKTPEGSSRIEQSYRAEPPHHLRGRAQVTTWLNKTEFKLSVQEGAEVEGLGVITGITDSQVTVDETEYSYEQFLEQLIESEYQPPLTVNQFKL